MIFIGKMMINGYWIESEFTIEYVHRIVRVTEWEIPVRRCVCDRV